MTSMDEGKSGRRYFPIDPAKGFPVGKNLYYECLLCGGVIPSMPDDDTRCKCRNIRIDVGFSRIVIDDPKNARLFSVDERRI